MFGWQRQRSLPQPEDARTIQFESHRGELAFIYQLEHDPTVLEYYDRPGAIKLTYQSKAGRRVGVLHTPDFFVLREDSCGWVECKVEDRLAELDEHMPLRYVRCADGTWSCPPGETYAEQFGLFYRIHSSVQINWVYQRNLRFLEDYLRGPGLTVPSETAATVRATVMRIPGISLLDLLHSLRQGTADDVYFLLVTDQIYADLTLAPLAKPDRVQVFLDQGIAQAYAICICLRTRSHAHLSCLFMKEHHCCGMGNPGQFSIWEKQPPPFFQRTNRSVPSLMMCSTPCWNKES
jgi:hypothetical protein